MVKQNKTLHRINLALGSVLILGTLVGAFFLTREQLYQNLRKKVIQNSSETEVLIESYKKTQRDLPLYTRGIIDCCGLVLDDKKENSHYLGHFSSCDDWQKVRDSITNSFSNLSNLEATVIFNVNSNSDAARSVLTTLDNLNLKNGLHYIKTDEVIIKSGIIYYDYCYRR